MWAIVAGTIKAFNFSLEYVLYELSYANMIMLGAVLPSYESSKTPSTQDKEINAEDPKNRDLVRSIFANS